MTTKIFISHSTKDAKLVNKLMDLLQIQFGLTRTNFFCTSDYELQAGNWINQIRLGMQESSLILPVITPNYLESKFCLCELGAAWVNEQNLVPVIIPPLNYNTALSETPYRSWQQTHTLDSTKAIYGLWDEFANRKIGQPGQIRSFQDRADDFYNEVLLPHVEELTKQKDDTFIFEDMLQLQADNLNLNSTLMDRESEINRLVQENKALRELKNEENLAEWDNANLSEWETFKEAVERTKQSLDDMSDLAVSVLYHSIKSNADGFGFYGADTERHELKLLESEGLIYFESYSFEPDYDHPYMDEAKKEINKLDSFIKQNKEIIEEHFKREYKGVRLGIKFSNFWEKVLGQKITHSIK